MIFEVAAGPFHQPALAHLASFRGVVDGVEPGLGVGGDGVFSSDDGVAGVARQTVWLGWLVADATP